MKRAHAGALAPLFALLIAGCPTSGPDGNDPLVRTDLDGLWQTTSTTGLANFCFRIFGDRVTQFGECRGAQAAVLDAERSVRGGNLIIWTFIIREADGATARHTLSVEPQGDATFVGTYAIRRDGDTFALTDDIIMTEQRLGI